MNVFTYIFNGPLVFVLMLYVVHEILMIRDERQLNDRRAILGRASQAFAPIDVKFNYPIQDTTLNNWIMRVQSIINIYIFEIIAPYVAKYWDRR